MKAKRVQLVTTLYGTRDVTVQELYELHREVDRAATLARRNEWEYRIRHRMGMLAAQGRL